MHILFLTDNFPPEGNAPASRTYEHCRAWVRAGHRVTVLTTAPNFPRGQIFPGYRNRLWQRETMDGIEVCRVFTLIFANKGVRRRTLDYMSFMVAGFIGSLFVRNVDVVVGTSPQFFTNCGAYAVSVLKRKPFVFELRDLWPASIHAVGAVRSSWPLRLIERLELFLYRKAARVVAVTRAYRDNLIARGIPAGKIDVVTNGVDLERYHPEPADSAELRQSLGLEGQFVAGYIGTLGMAHHLETVLRAAQRIQELDRENPDVQGQRPLTILLVGDGARREELIAQSVELGLTNLRFIDAVPKDAVVAYWGLLDAGIIHVASNPVFESVIPSKLFECMAMGVPVLHGLRGESADLVRETGCGEVFEPDNVDQLVELLQLWRQSDTDLRYYSEAGVRTAQRFDRALLADRMLRILECCAKQPPRLGLAAQAKASEASEQHATHTPRH